MEARGVHQGDEADDSSSYCSSASAWSSTSRTSSTSSSASTVTSSGRRVAAVGRGLHFQGSIRVERSTDCHFGNTLHYYGPVTLRVEDAKVINGLPLAIAPPPGKSKSTAARIRATLKTFLRWPRLSFLIVLVVTVLAGIFTGLLMAYFRGDFDPEVPANVSFVTREQWEAENQKYTPLELANPVPIVIVHHTNSETCFNLTDCSIQLNKLQSLDFRNGFPDIVYNFLVGGDGRVYEGRGWQIAGEHCKNWNSKSLGVALVGTFTYDTPASEQFDALALLLKWGVQNRKIEARYKLAGKCQLKNNPSPGAGIMDRIRRWEHWWNYAEGDHSCSEASSRQSFSLFNYLFFLVLCLLSADML